MATGDLFGGYIYAKTLEGFQAQLEAGNVSETQIAIIEDQQLFWTHGQYYKFEQADSGTEYDFEMRYVYAYGVQWDSSSSSPSCTRIGNATLHATLPVQSGMVGGLLDDDGNFTEFGDQSDWTSYDRSGESGQVMVKIPEHYEYFSDDGETKQVWMSLYNITGFTKVPTQYVGAYEAALDRTNLKLCSIVNTDEQYIGGYGTSDEESYAADDYTLCGLPATYISLTNFRTYARNRGTAGYGGCGWNCYTYQAYRTLCWLIVVEYATRNSQATYNSELTDDGYHQGGLGNGVTTLNSTYWSSWNNYNPFIPCGYTDELGNTTGVVSFSMPSGYTDLAGSSVTVSVPRYRGIENPWGHIWKWTDGALFINTDAYTTDDPTLFSSTDYSGYTLKSENAYVASGWSYIKEVLFGNTGDLLADADNVGGSSSTYWCDGIYGSSSNSTLRGLRVGGDAYYGSLCGFACAHTNNAPSDASRARGSRLCFLPE